MSEPRLPLRQAALLGLLHGPTELLPISSSGHTTLIPWLRGWSYDELDPAARKRFEVALHAGALAGLTLSSRAEIARVLAGRSAQRLLLLALASAPAAAAGLALERPIERRLGAPRGIAVGLLGGSMAMAAGERLGSQDRHIDDATPLDGLLLGLAQAVALAPGVSRRGAAHAAARALGFAHEDATRLAFEVGIPVTAGALLVKGREALHADHSEWPALAVGASTAFLSTAISGTLSQGRSLLPYAAYRTALAGTVFRRLRRRDAVGARSR